MAIPIGVAGRISNLQPSEQPYILVQDDGKKSGGYLIFHSSSPRFDVPPVYDGWCLKEELEDYFAAQGWEVQWSEERPIPHHGLLF